MVKDSPNVIRALALQLHIDYLKGFFNVRINHGKTTKVLMLEGETLFHQGDKGDKAYMIVLAALDVVVDGKKVGYMKDGEVFGEMALNFTTKQKCYNHIKSVYRVDIYNKENLDELINSASSKDVKSNFKFMQRTC